MKEWAWMWPCSNKALFTKTDGMLDLQSPWVLVRQPLGLPNAIKMIPMRQHLFVCQDWVYPWSMKNYFDEKRLYSYFVFHLFLFLLISKRAHWAVFPQGKLALLNWGWTHHMAFVKNPSSLMSWTERGEGKCLWWGQVGADGAGRRDSQSPPMVSS